MKTVFLDRDGVINRNLENDYVTSWSEFEFIPKSLDAIRLLTHTGYQLIVVTNQACINKGILSLENLKIIHRKMLSEIQNVGGRISAIYHCPHRDDEDCACRKPKAGMLLRAAAEHKIDPDNTYLIGDSERDIRAGNEFGACSLLVLTGNGHKSDLINRASDNAPNQSHRVFADFHAAAEWIVSSCAT
ncbi:MAG: D-glycero-beta-D-manno-heptose 1,7-bisphosphate 7-phosphatase, partial [Candidatus Poribacteria bacterium]|nr:D-glycero-beta-D-manno-heptose 1,7-bisphosphate 7-phosphatase [Candidatus Poribacteria bacterium]